MCLDEFLCDRSVRVAQQLQGVYEAEFGGLIEASLYTELQEAHSADSSLICRTKWRRSIHGAQRSLYSE